MIDGTDISFMLGKDDAGYTVQTTVGEWGISFDEALLKQLGDDKKEICADLWLEKAYFSITLVLFSGGELYARCHSMRYASEEEGSVLDIPLSQCSRAD